MGRGAEGTSTRPSACPGAARGLRWRAPLASFALAIAACGGRGAPSSSASATAPPASTPVIAPIVAREDPPGVVAPSNPLGLPPARVTLDAGKRVFTFSDQMMVTARPGATLVLSATTVAGLEGDDLLIEGHDRPPYKVHAGYVIPVPDLPKIRIGDPVLTEHAGLMRHGVVLRFVKDRIAVRFTDAGRAPEALLLGGSGAPKPGGPSKAARFVRQAEGLAPGNFAVLRDGDDWLHVLLVSASGDGASRRWFALGFGGAAMVVAEADLKPIPLKPRPKLGATVWAESAGKMRRATLQAIDEPGLFTVKYERAGRPGVVGYGFVMAPLVE
jgi:hypothetical protein